MNLSEFSRLLIDGVVETPPVNNVPQEKYDALAQTYLDRLLLRVFEFYAFVNYMKGANLERLDDGSYRTQLTFKRFPRENVKGITELMGVPNVKVLEFVSDGEEFYGFEAVLTRQDLEIR